MKKLLFLFCFIIPVISFAQSNRDKEAILGILESQRKSWNRGDIDQYMNGYWKSDSLLFVGKNGATWGYENTLKNYKKSYPDKDAMGELIFGNQEVKFLAKDVAFVLGSWDLKRKADNPGGFFTLIFRKIGGNWVLVADHSS